MKSAFAFILGLSIAVSAQAQAAKPPKETAMERFLRYVKIDTQSAEDQPTTPSTKKQFNLANLLATELKALGAQDRDRAIDALLRRRDGAVLVPGVQHAVMLRDRRRQHEEARLLREV